MWHVSSSSGAATVRTAIHLLLVTIPAARRASSPRRIRGNVRIVGTPTGRRRAVNWSADLDLAIAGVRRRRGAGRPTLTRHLTAELRSVMSSSVTKYTADRPIVERSKMPRKTATTTTTIHRVTVADFVETLAFGLCLFS